MTKHEIRSAMKRFLATQSDQDLHRRSLAACDKLMATDEFKNARTIMIYMSMPREVETHTLAVQAWRDGKSIAVPRVEWGLVEGGRMEAVEIRSLDVGMQMSGPGIRQPIDSRVILPGEIDMVVVPGLGFDRCGGRVGRGGGFYDRFLSRGEGQDFRGVRCALCFHEQLLTEAVPCEPHDVAMDMIVTDQDIVRCAINTEFTL
ncbi:MAG: 5-formyltetrahydrofolate cyclo-ligase [Phycisphaerales bacterium]|nr:5-formyltetrahydrofolate cyclo-ligase [Phycisphaerales bacterium]